MSPTLSYAPVSSHVCDAALSFVACRILFAARRLRGLVVAVLRCYARMCV